jgi:hypothetical protein
MSPGRWRRLSHWLDVLLDLSAEERAQRLARREPDLADELRSALGAQRELAEARFLERSVLHFGASNLQGRQVGRYAVERLLANGRSAEVWLARQAGQHPGDSQPGSISAKSWECSMPGSVKRQCRS